MWIYHLQWQPKDADLFDEESWTTIGAVLGQDACDRTLEFLEELWPERWWAASIEIV